MVFFDIIMLLSNNYHKDNSMLNNNLIVKEEWKTLQNFSRYLISNTGKVYSNKIKKNLSFFKQNSGYLCVDLWDDNNVFHRFLVHRLIAITWINNPLNKKYINHKDGNKLNNNITNLEWCTMSENILHARKTGLNPYNLPTLNKKLEGQRKSTSKYFGVCWDKTRKKWRAALVYQGKPHCQKRFNTEIEAAQYYNELVKKFKLTSIKQLNNV